VTAPIDLSGAVDAGVDAWLHDLTDFATPRQRMETALRAALPRVEAAVREQIARDIEQSPEGKNGIYQWDRALAARIARGEQP